jgi:uncharacterized protein
MKNHSAERNSATFQDKRKADVTKIYNGELSEITLEFALDGVKDELSEYEFEQAPTVAARVYEKARGKTGAESYVVLDVKIEGEYTCSCARCTKELTKTLCINETFGITTDEDNDSEEYVIAPSGVLDVEEAARTLFYLSLPQRVLCKDDCLGLCPVCGTDLNGFTCSCKQPERGNRLTDLKKLLDNYSEK